MKMELVDQLVVADRQYHPNLGGITRGGLANHYPMTILALQGLGASNEEVDAFGKVWPRQRARIIDDLRLVDRGMVTTANWTEFLGESELLVELQRVFSEMLAARNNDLEVVAEVLAVMKRSLPMGLFHPVIRLSFAVDHGDRGLIADALAYMAIRYFDLYRREVVSSHQSDDAGWRNLRVSAQAKHVLHAKEGASIRICEELCADPELQQQPTPPPQEIASLALRLYLLTPSLTTLHAVTASHALADLTQRATTENQRATFANLWTHYWIWLSALYIEKGQPTELPAFDPKSSVEATWDELAAIARAIPEVHLIKMTYSCRWMDEHFAPNPLYKIAVANMLTEGRAHPKESRGWLLHSVR